MISRPSSRRALEQPVAAVYSKPVITSLKYGNGRGSGRLSAS